MPCSWGTFIVRDNFVRAIRRNRMLISVAAAVLMVSCARQQHDDTAAECGKTLLDVREHSVNIALRADSSVIRLTEDLFLTLDTTAPAELDLLVPPAIEFVNGFAVQGEFDELPVRNNGMITRRRRLHLRPHTSADYSIGPVPVRFLDRSRNPATSGSIKLESVSFPLALPVAPPPEDIVVVFNPAAARIPVFSLLLKITPVIAGVLIVLLLGLHMRRKTLQPAVPLSSREEALKELRELMDLDLLREGRTEEFYRTLAEIVRRYIERTHSIMAREETTEELLAAVAEDSRFDSAAAESLARFFHEADFVKFAALQPESGDVADEVDLARSIIEKNHR